MFVFYLTVNSVCFPQQCRHFAVCAERLRCVPAAFQSLDQISRKSVTEISSLRSRKPASGVGSLEAFSFLRQERNKSKNEFQSLLLGRFDFACEYMCVCVFFSSFD